MATKEQERKALEQIKAIVEGLGEDSYVRKAFEGCFEDAEENIRLDVWVSMRDRFEQAREDLSELAKLETKSRKRAESLAKQLEREQEWKPYMDTHNVSQAEYESIAKDAAKELTDEEAKDFLYRQFGFAREKVQIVRQIPKYEVNRHRQLRKVGAIDRRPVYKASDWFYIRFNCGAMEYELWNGNLNFFIG